jgi:Rhodopirellula transposase DDE domain
MSPLRWTAKSTRALADELTAQGHKVSPDTVGDLLREEGFSLQGNAKTIEGAQHPDRDAQFRYISEQARACQDAGDPCGLSLTSVLVLPRTMIRSRRRVAPSRP